MKQTGMLITQAKGPFSTPKKDAGTKTKLEFGMLCCAATTKQAGTLRIALHEKEQEQEK